MIWPVYYTEIHHTSHKYGKCAPFRSKDARKTLILHTAAQKHFCYFLMKNHHQSIFLSAITYAVNIYTFYVSSFLSKSVKLLPTCENDDIHFRYDV